MAEEVLNAEFQCLVVSCYLSHWHTAINFFRGPGECVSKEKPMLILQATLPATSSPSAQPETKSTTDVTPITNASEGAAIGDEPQNIESTPVTEPGSATLLLTLLLPSSGARHPYKIDEKYLIKRNVPVPGNTESGKKDPFSISVYTLKELILREWRDEWEAKPSSPVSIRLIHFGRLLDDKITLKGMYLFFQLQFQTDD